VHRILREVGDPTWTVLEEVSGGDLDAGQHQIPPLFRWRLNKKSDQENSHSSA
jgi:hypothetical protein